MHLYTIDAGPDSPKPGKLIFSVLSCPLLTRGRKCMPLQPHDQERSPQQPRMPQVLKHCVSRDFPDWPVVRTPRFHCRGHLFNPWLGNQDSACLVARPKNKTKKHPTVSLDKHCLLKKNNLIRKFKLKSKWDTTTHLLVLLKTKSWT